MGRRPITFCAMIIVGMQVPTEPSRNANVGPGPKPKLSSESAIGISSPSQTYRGIPIPTAEAYAQTHEVPIYSAIAPSGISAERIEAIKIPSTKYFPNSRVMLLTLLQKLTFVSVSQPQASPEQDDSSPELFCSVIVTNPARRFCSKKLNAIPSMTAAESDAFTRATVKPNPHIPLLMTRV